MKTIFLICFILLLNSQMINAQNRQVIERLEPKEIVIYEIKSIKSKLEQNFPFKNQKSFMYRCLPTINKSNVAYFINDKVISEEEFSTIWKNKYKIKKIKDIKVLNKVEIKQKFKIDIEDKAILVYTKKYN